MKQQRQWNPRSEDKRYSPCTSREDKTQHGTHEQPKQQRSITFMPMNREQATGNGDGGCSSKSKQIRGLGTHGCVLLCGAK
ncbi:MAG: hypothetical protein JO098_02945 [Candidatus Eremiobacteraeota bacterium]|nr:hypothetical protein [Candidatus Eremiobacteraeota bacterium]